MDDYIYLLNLYIYESEIKTCSVFVCVFVVLDGTVLLCSQSF